MFPRAPKRRAGAREGSRLDVLVLVDQDRLDGRLPALARRSPLILVAGAIGALAVRSVACATSNNGDMAAYGDWQQSSYVTDHNAELKEMVRANLRAAYGNENQQEKFAAQP